MVNYSRFIGRVIELMKMPSVIKSPAGKMPKKAPRWDLTYTKGCSGGKVFPWMPLVVWEYIGARIRSGGHEGPTRVG